MSLKNRKKPYCFLNRSTELSNLASFKQYSCFSVSVHSFPIRVHSCSFVSIRVPFVFHSCSICVPFVFHSCSIRVPFVFHPCSFVFTRVHSCSLVFIRVHSCSFVLYSCSIRVHSCSFVLHSCSLVFIRVPFVFICVHSCSFVFICVHPCSFVFIRVHSCSLVFHSCSHLCGVLENGRRDWLYGNQASVYSGKFSIKADNLCEIAN